MTYFKLSLENPQLTVVVMKVELVSNELNHLAAIIIFQKENGNTFNHFYSEKSSKRAK